MAAIGGGGASMVLGFWNVQRVGNPESKSWQASLRHGLVDSHILPWLGGNPSPAPDVLILCEISDSGQKWADEINAALGATYSAVFLQNPTQANLNFLVVTKGKPSDVGFVGGSGWRPIVHVAYNGFHVAGIHAKADRGEGALASAQDAVTELGSSGAAVIGDMNLTVDAISDYDRSYFTGAGYDYVLPGYNTHRGKTVLDYIWVNTGSYTAKSLGLINWTDWEVIDHAPVMYQLTQK